MRGEAVLLKTILESDFALDDGGGREQAHDGERGDGFSGAGFADQAEDFAGAIENERLATAATGAAVLLLEAAGAAVAAERGRAAGTGWSGCGHPAAGARRIWYQRHVIRRYSADTHPATWTHHQLPVVFHPVLEQAPMPYRR